MLLGVQEVGDQGEHLRGFRGAVFRGGVHGVLDDADCDDGAVALAGGPQFRQVGAVGQDFHRLQGEGRRGAPQDVRPSLRGGSPDRRLAPPHSPVCRRQGLDQRHMREFVPALQPARG